MDSHKWMQLHFLNIVVFNIFFKFVFLPNLFIIINSPENCNKLEESKCYSVGNLVTSSRNLVIVLVVQLPLTPVLRSLIQLLVIVELLSPSYYIFYTLLTQNIKS